jgi:predicted lipoprotein with Yx(FWY)xxD motif
MAAMETPGVLGRAATASVRAIPIPALVAVLGGLAMATALAATTTTTVRSNNSPRYGRILASPSRHTLYYWCPGTSTRCANPHSASSWPPLIARGRLVAAAHSGVNGHKLGSLRLKGGQRQVTYYGQPVYLYKGDRKPCAVNGEDRVSGNGSFFVITTSGRPEPTPCYLGSGQCPPVCGK